jgi:DNA-binding response OmpR family regulator
LRGRRKPSVMKGSEKYQGERIRLLLVDDEEGYVKVLAKRMTRRNMEVMTALSGSEGIQRLRKQDFDVAILDLKMEDMDGIEVLRVFKKMVPDMPVIMLTGHGTEKAAREGLEVGAFDYLMKPCDLEELVEKIRAACRR